MSLPHLKRLPASRASNTKPPLLILLHGYGSNEADLFNFANMLDERFLVLSPRAPRPLAQGGYAWFDLGFSPDGSLTHAPEQVLAAQQQLSAFIREAVTTYAADPTRVYLLGFSQGAMMSASVALTKPSLIAGAVMMSGLIPDEVQPLITPPDQLNMLRMFVGHGTQDEVVPVADVLHMRCSFRCMFNTSIVNTLSVITFRMSRWMMFWGDWASRFDDIS